MSGTVGLFNPLFMADSHELTMRSLFETGRTHRVLVRWHDDEHAGELRSLGQLSDSPPDMGSLILDFRYDRTEDTLLIAFELHFKINAASKGVRSLYLAIPVKHLEVTVVCPMLDAANHPMETREFQKAGMNGSTKVVRLMLSLKELGYVTMPLQGFNRQMSTKSKGLLLSLRSLSRAIGFEVYLPYVGDELLKVFQECSEGLREGRLEMPTIDYDKSYHGRAWGKNQWSIYHLKADETLPTAWNPLVDDCPPSYEEVVSSTLPASREAPEATPELRSTNPAPGSRATTLNGRANMPASLSMPLPPSTLPDQRPTRLSAATEEQHNNRDRKRKAEQLPEDLRHGRQAEQQDAAIPKKQKIGETPLQESGESSPPRSPPDFRSASISQSSVIDGGPNRRFFDDVQYRYFSDAVAWLRAAWYVQPDAHEAFLPELRILAQAARERDIGRYDHVRVNCTYMLCRRERISESSGPFSSEFAIDDQARYIFNFVYREIGLGRDLLILDELIALDDVARMWKEVDRLDRSDEWQRMKLMFLTQMAVCILVALYRDDQDWSASATTRAE